MNSEAFRVMSITVAGEVVEDLDVGSATLQVIGPTPDFELRFSTPHGHNLPNDQVELEVLVSDGRTYAGTGIDAMPNPWSHRYVNGRGVPGWKSR